MSATLGSIGDKALLDAPAAAPYLCGMAKEIPSVSDLRCECEVTDEEIGAATAACMKDGNTKPFAFKPPTRCLA